MFTSLQGLTGLGLDVTVVSKQIQHGVATSASISNGGREAPSGPILTVLGDQRKFLKKLLLVEYKLPLKLVKGLEQQGGAPGGKKVAGSGGKKR